MYLSKPQEKCEPDPETNETGSEAMCQDQCVDVLKKIKHFCTEEALSHDSTGLGAALADGFKHALSQCPGQNAVSSGTSGTTQAPQALDAAESQNAVSSGAPTSYEPPESQNAVSSGASGTWGSPWRMLLWLTSCLALASLSLSA